MPKHKTNKATLKRFKLTKTSKIIRGRQYGRHLRASKSASQKRRHKEPIQVAKGMAKTIRRLIGV
ncbi:50S ribosomal protein L35 [Candidatus Gottesmanbacteria bacterium]|nr:50S ribosomal protein L35 [Candidatus Gottesmanbacteria bacterium]